MKMHTFNLKAALAAVSMVTLVSGYAHMVKPMTFLAPESQLPYDSVDYQIDNSLFLNGTNYPCKGYQHSPLVKSSETLRAGETSYLEIVVAASHAGGICELSLSYENRLTFRVFKRFIGGCPASESNNWKAEYQIPSYAPSGKKVIFSWTWFPLSGNKEMWQSCSFVDIRGIPKKEDAARFHELPPAWRGDLLEFSDTCITEEQYHLTIDPPLSEGVQIEYSRDGNGYIPSPEKFPYTFYTGQCDNDKKIASSWAYERMDGMNSADCNIPRMVPCSKREGWPTRESYERACTRNSDPVGWMQFPTDCGGYGPVSEESVASALLMDQSK